MLKKGSSLYLKEPQNVVAYLKYLVCYSIKQDEQGSCLLSESTANIRLCQRKVHVIV